MAFIPIDPQQPKWFREAKEQAEKFHALRLSIEVWARDTQMGGDTTTEMRAFIEAEKELYRVTRNPFSSDKLKPTRWETFLSYLGVMTWQEYAARNNHWHEALYIKECLDTCRMRYAIMYPQIADNDWLKDKLV